MKSSLTIAVFLAASLAVCSGTHLTTPADVTTGTNAILTDNDEDPTTSLSSLLGTSANQATATTATGNNVAISRSNIFVVGDQDKKMLVDTIKNMVTGYDSSSQDDGVLTTQIVTLLGAGGKSSLTSANKMLPQIKAAIQNRDKPVRLRQIVVKLVETSPKMEAYAAGNQAS